MRGSSAFLILSIGLSAVACSGSPTRTDSDPLHASCADGDLDACHRFATQQEEQSPDGRHRALITYQYACLLDHQPSCAGLARMYGQDPSASRDRMVDAMESACAGGEAEACVQLAARGSRSRALALLKKACDADNGQGCHELAELTRRRWMVEASVVEALRLDEKACELGSVDGCVAAGKAYLFGSGVAADTEKGLAMLEPTCGAETIAGCELLANIWEQGIGVEPDLAKASEYYDRAEQNAPDEPIESPSTAFIVFVDACSRGDLLGCFDAGWFRAEGVEVPRNITVARELFEVACRGGLTTACGRWETIESSSRISASAEPTRGRAP